MQNRPLRPFEQGAHLHVLDWCHQTARQRFQAAGAAQVKAAAKAWAMPADLGGNPPDLPSLEAAIADELRKLYALGHATVRSEIDHQRNGSSLPIGLSQAPAPRKPKKLKALALDDSARDPGRLRARARLVAAAAAHAIWQAIHRARLQGISDQRRLQEVGQLAGSGALRQAATHHAGGAINAGRHASALSINARGKTQIIGARYTSVLDKNTCGPCAEADTGELLALNSPEWIPTPNPACLGGDRCRCIHVYQLATERETAPGPEYGIRVVA